MSGAEALKQLSLDFASSSIEQKLSAGRRILVASKLLGVAGTRDSLLPLIKGLLSAEDELLQVFAEQLGQLVPFVGGPSEAHHLLPLLAQLAGAEETVVHGAAVASLRAVVGALPAGGAADHVVPMLQSLATNEWFTSRCSAAALLPPVYAKLGGGPPETLAALRALFATLTADETPMVRRAAAEHLGALVPLVDGAVLEGELLPRFSELVGDDQDSVRLLALEAVRALGPALGPARAAGALLPVFRAMAGDKSWRARQVCVREAAGLTRALGAPEAVLPLLERLLSDPEGEVRAAALRAAPAFLALSPPAAFKTHVAPGLQHGLADALTAVRLAAAEALVAVCGAGAPSPAPGDAPAMAPEQALTLLLAGLRDEAAEVRLALAGLGGLAARAGAAAQEEKIVPALEALAKDKVWRVRERFVTQLPALARSLPLPLFQAKLLPLFLESFSDQVSAVRTATAHTLGPLRVALGSEWLGEFAAPHLRLLLSQPESSYLQRLAALAGIRSACEGDGGAAGGAGEVAARDAICNEFLPLVVECSRDAVANVRSAAAAVLGHVAALSPGVAAEGAVEALRALESDTEFEVRQVVVAALGTKGGS